MIKETPMCTDPAIPSEILTPRSSVSATACPPQDGKGVVCSGSLVESIMIPQESPGGLIVIRDPRLSDAREGSHRAVDDLKNQGAPSL